MGTFLRYRRSPPCISPQLPLSPLIGMRQNLPRERRNQVDTNYPKKIKRRFAPHRGTPTLSHHRWATPPSPAGINPPALVGFYLSHSGMSHKAHAVNFDKIPKNTIKLDKFTGFFDKKRAREISVKHCNSMVTDMNLSAGDSGKRQKNFGAPHLPAFGMKQAGFPAFPRKKAQPRVTGRSSTAGLPSRAAPRRRRRCPLPHSPARRPSAGPATRRS